MSNTAELLNDRFPLHRSMIKMAESGLMFVVVCTEENMMPEPEGFATQAEAEAKAVEFESIIMNPGTEYEFTCAHAVYEITRDEDGDFQSTFEDIR